MDLSSSAARLATLGQSNRRDEPSSCSTALPSSRSRISAPTPGEQSGLDVHSLTRVSRSPPIRTSRPSNVGSNSRSFATMHLGPADRVLRRIKNFSGNAGCICLVEPLLQYSYTSIGQASLANHRARCHHVAAKSLLRVPRSCGSSWLDRTLEYMGFRQARCDMIRCDSTLRWSSVAFVGVALIGRLGLRKGLRSPFHAFPTGVWRASTPLAPE